MARSASAQPSSTLGQNQGDIDPRTGEPYPDGFGIKRDKNGKLVPATVPIGTEPEGGRWEDEM